MTQLADDETIVFGPSRREEQTQLSVKSEARPGQMTHTSFRTVCITNKRVIIESGDSTIHYPNTDIRVILINRGNNKKEKVGFFNILQLKTGAGNAVKLEIPGISNDKEELLKETFPNAQIKERSGITGFLDQVFGS
jgi:hypothetical protein